MNSWSQKDARAAGVGPMSRAIFISIDQSDLSLLSFLSHPDRSLIESISIRAQGDLFQDLDFKICLPRSEVSVISGLFSPARIRCIEGLLKASTNPVQ